MDTLSGRKYNQRPALDRETLVGLNNYFGSLCLDQNYGNIESLITDIKECPRLSLTQVLSSLSNIKKTSSGPDGIPYWVLRDYAVELAPVVLHLWNLSLCTQKWPRIWKEANIHPLPKVNIPLQNSDYRGINVTPIIARTFEKIVYRTFCKSKVEQQLSKDQFAYTEKEGVAPML